MTRTHLGRIGVVAFSVGMSGCFSEAPGLDESGQTEDGTGESSASVTTAPTTTGVDADSTIGGVDGSDGSSEGPPCEAGDPECVSPGETVWTVREGGPENDGAYSIVVDDGDVVVVGEQGAGADLSHPWFARIDDEGALLWSMATPGGKGISPLRGVVSVGDGRTLAVGSTQPGATASLAYFEARDASGDAVLVEPYNYGDANILLGLALDGSGGFYSVGYAAFGVPEGAPQPMVLHHTSDPPSWALDSSSFDGGQLATIEGALFGVDLAPNGDVVAVGYVSDGDTSDAMVLLFTAGGDLLDGPITIGEAYSDDFTDVAVDDDGSAIAVGRQGTGATTSDILMLHFTVDGSIATGWQYAWGDAAFNSANGFARAGDAVFIAAGTSDDPGLTGPSFESLILRWDGEANAPTWTAPFEADSAGRDFASDVALAPDGTLVACGVFTPDGSENGDAWIRKLAR